MSKQWTYELIQQLHALCAQGLSYQEIADVMHISRNAALGKAQRLGISNGNKPDTLKVGSYTWRRKQRNSVSCPMLPAAMLDHRPAGPTVHVMDLRPDHCRFPMWGHREQPNFQYCGHKVADEGMGWCPYHNAVVHGCGTTSERRATTLPRSDEFAPVELKMNRERNLA